MSRTAYDRIVEIRNRLRTDQEDELMARNKIDELLSDRKFVKLAKLFVLRGDRSQSNGR